jgi:hypothetical protein
MHTPVEETCHMCTDDPSYMSMGLHSTLQFHYSGRHRVSIFRRASASGGARSAACPAQKNGRWLVTWQIICAFSLHRRLLLVEAAQRWKRSFRRALESQLPTSACMMHVPAGHWSTCFPNMLARASGFSPILLPFKILHFIWPNISVWLPPHTIINIILYLS